MGHTVFHIEDETAEFQALVYAAISRAAEYGIQLTPMDFTNNDGVPCIDAADAGEWIDTICGQD
jgi:ribosomal protein S12 methylthiotransferase accessory factor YcaO